MTSFPKTDISNKLATSKFELQKQHPGWLIKGSVTGGYYIDKEAGTLITIDKKSSKKAKKNKKKTK